MSSLLLHLALSVALTTATPGAVTPPVAAIDSTNAAARIADRAYVEVDNQNFNDANVYVIQGLRRTRLGTVTGLSKQRFTLPRDMIGGAMPVQFVVRPLASWRSSWSDEISVYAGDTVGLVIPPF